MVSFPEITEPVFKLDTQGRFMLYGGILIYAAIVVLIGWWASRRVNNMSDFLVAGRRLPLWMASATLLATWFGAGPSMAATGAVFEKGGLKNIIADPFAAAISLILAGIFIVGILRRNRLLTVTEIVERKFGVAAGVYTSIWMIPVYVGWLSAQVLGMGKLLQLVLGVSTPIGTLIGAGVVLLYTIAGGMWAVTITDVVQVALIIVGLLIIVPSAVNGVGGFGELFANISPDELSLLPEGGQDFSSTSVIG